MSNKANAFIEWLDILEAAKGYSDYEVAKKGGFSHSVLSRARSGIPPKWDVCVSIAVVFSVSPITAFRKAGLLPNGNEDQIKFDDWQYLLNQLSPEEESEVREIVERKIDRRSKEQSLKILKTKRSG